MNTIKIKYKSQNSDLQLEPCLSISLSCYESNFQKLCDAKCLQNKGHFLNYFKSFELTQCNCHKMTINVNNFVTVNYIVLYMVITLFCILFILYLMITLFSIGLLHYFAFGDYTILYSIILYLVIMLFCI